MKFHYVAQDNTGKRQRGEVDADSPRTARMMLRERQLVVVALKRRERRTVSLSSRARAVIKGGELVLFTRQLATLTGASLPVDEALYALEQQSEKPGNRQLISQLRNKVVEGLSLSEALEREQATFSVLYRALVAAGEASGHLTSVLSRLADHLELSQQIKNRLLQALLYPLVLTVVATGVIAILLTAVVPKVVEQFIHLNQTLPLSTRILIKISEILLDYGTWLAVAILCTALFVRQVLRRDGYRLHWDRRWLSLPVVGKVTLDLNLARYARTLSILTGSAVPVLEAMHMAISVCINLHIRKCLHTAQQQVREGTGVSVALASTGLLSPMMRHMITSGESSGELEKMLERAADIQEQTFQGQLSLAVGIFTPVLVMVMAGFVFFIVLAILQPILQLNSMVG